MKGQIAGPADARDRIEVCRRRVGLNGRDRQRSTDGIDVLELRKEGKGILRQKSIHLGLEQFSVLFNAYPMVAFLRERPCSSRRSRCC